MVFFFFSSVPIEEDSSLQCDLIGNNSISTIEMRRGSVLKIYSLYVPIGKSSYERNVLAHSKTVKGLDANGGFKSIMSSTISIERNSFYGIDSVSTSPSKSVLSWSTGKFNKFASLTQIFAIKNTLTDIVPAGTFSLTDVDRKALFFDVASSIWKYKTIVDMSKVQTMTYRNLDDDISIIDFEKFTISPPPPSRTKLFKSNKFFYMVNGRLKVKRTSDKSIGNKSDLENICKKDPSSFLSFGSDKSITDKMMLLTKRAGKYQLDVDKMVMIFCLQPQMEMLQIMMPTASNNLFFFNDSLKQSNPSVYKEMTDLSAEHPLLTWYIITHPPTTGIVKDVSQITFSITQYYTEYQDTSRINLTNSLWYTEPGDQYLLSLSNKDVSLKGRDISGIRPPLMSNADLANAKESTANIILLLYNEFVQQLYYTPSNQYIPLIAMVVGERRQESLSLANYSYRNITKRTVAIQIGDTVHTNTLDILIKDLGGNNLERIVDSSSKRKPVKDLLFSIS